MPAFKAVLRRLLRHSSSSPIPMETLEPRKLLSSGPTVTGVQLIGNVHNITSLVVTFNESLNPATAQDPQAILFGKPPPPGSDNGLSVGDFLPFLLAKPRPRTVIAGKIVFSSLTYNDANHSVTLVPLAPFRAERFMRVLRVKGTGAHVIKDVAGNVLNGGADTVIRWTPHQGKRVHYIDDDGEGVTFTLRGRGKLFTFTRRKGDPAPTIFIDGATAASVLTGKLVRGRSGDGVAHIAEIEGLGAVQNNVLNNPAFQVQAIQP